MWEEHDVLKTNVPDKADDSEDTTHVQDMRVHDEFKNNGPVGGQRRLERQFRAGSVMSKKT